MKRLLVTLLFAALLLSLTACRERTTTLAGPDSVPAEGQEERLQEDAPSPSPQDGPEQEQPPEETPPPQPEPDAPTEEDPDSDRKEYSDQADAELSADAEAPIAVPADAPPEDAPAAPVPDGGGAGAAVQEEGGEQTATETVPADEEDALGADQAGETADTMLLYYQTLLADRLGGLFECQRLYVYWETAEDHTTIFKTSQEHQLILDAGAYDVSAKLLAENLVVDDGWIARKAPGMVVKVVNEATLGSGVQSTAAAEAVYDGLLAREGWTELDAVKNGRVVLLSESLLTTPARRTAAAVYLAKAMYPSLFSDVDGDEALELLTEEAGGTAASGVFVWVG